ncbi:hypothetical protein AGLY_014640 [Aphis glycines]|uniref:MULE transposase domain-containing protein n=1 Tax=Aphis glycines TaxID=307491 RepID=A0A6G0T1R4_APHGL|nr:hypothetical protein AGLY_014640 [Aphis glycines]
MAMFIKSKRDKDIVSFTNFKYNFASKNVSTDEIRWRCVKRTCSATLYTSNSKVVNEEDILITDQLRHNHKSCSDVEINRQILSENTQLTDGFTSNDFNVIRKSIYRSRRKVLPLIPTTIAEAHMALNTPETTFTTKNEPFVLVNDEIKNIIIFSCKTNLMFLYNVVETIYMDDTFQFCAKFFEQMFCIHGFKNGHYIPLIFILLPDKKYETYVYTFKSIVNKCKELGLVFIPKFVTIDFEKAIHLAVNEVWPSSKIVGCRFHLTQAWYRNVQKYGLATEYQNNTSIGNWIQYTFGLIFFEPSEVSDCFTQDLMAECLTDEKLVKYCDYLVENYISEDSVFSPTLWAYSQFPALTPAHTNSKPAQQLVNVLVSTICSLATVNLYSKETNFFPEYHIFNGSSPTTLHIGGGAEAL